MGLKWSAGLSFYASEGNGLLTRCLIFIVKLLLWVQEGEYGRQRLFGAIGEPLLTEKPKPLCAPLTRNYAVHMWHPRFAS